MRISNEYGIIYYILVDLTYKDSNFQRKYS